ncbi:MAG: hypothetical protein HC773_08315 [Scytonema sp. CRU_2_7]|nr:hypothetical protein [Scytonema sp. CRU_2_7]
MFTRKVNWLWLLVIGGTVTACTRSTPVNLSDKDERNTTQAQAETVPDYPPMYDVDVKVCGNIIAPLKEEKRCVNKQLRLWGPVGEAKLVRAGISLPSVSSVEHKLAIARKAVILFTPNLPSNSFIGLIPLFKSTGEELHLQLRSNQLNFQTSRFMS